MFNIIIKFPYVHNPMDLVLLAIHALGTSPDSAVGYGLDDRGVEVRAPIGSRIFISPCRRDRLWGPPNLLSNGYREPFPQSKAVGA
jgi:hypothetical protein